MALLFGSLLLDIGALSTLLLALIYLYFKHAFTYWKARKVPYLEPSFPFGNFSDRVLGYKSLPQVHEDIYHRLRGERFGGTYVFSKPEFLFRDPELIKSALVKDFAHFQDRGFHINEDVEPLQGNLFFLSGQKWKNLRTKLTPTFTSGKMKMMFQTLVDCGVELGGVLDRHAGSGDVLEMKDFLARYSTDVISSCAFGIQSNSLRNPEAEFRRWGRKLFDPSKRRVVVGLAAQVMPAVVDLFKVSTVDPEVARYFTGMVRETVKYREDGGLKRNDFMQLLIQLRNQGDGDGPSAGNGLSMNSLAAQAFVFFVAGFETSSTTMTFCLYELALNPDIQEILRGEVRTVLEKHGGKITYEAMMEMTYMDKIVAETLRKYPPVVMLNRDVTQKYKIPGSDVVLEKGMKTVIPVWALHHDPKYFPNPERFDPERFSEEEKAKRHPYVYLPFGEGPRICIGMRFGLMQTKIGLASLLSKFRFSVSDRTPIPLPLEKRKSLILSHVGGMWLKINRCS